MKKGNIAAVAFGGFIGGYIAFSVWPIMWWLGAIAGAVITGYTYEWSITRANIRPAFEATRIKTRRVWNAIRSVGGEIYGEVSEGIKEHFSEPQPFFFLPILAGVAGESAFFAACQQFSGKPPLQNLPQLFSVGFIFWIFFLQFMNITIEIGSYFYGERVAGRDVDWDVSTAAFIPESRACEEWERERTPATYGNVMRWMLRGTQQFLITLFIRFPLYVIKGILKIASRIILSIFGFVWSCAVFATLLALYIICEERVLAMTSTAAGIVAGYLLLGGHAPTQEARIMAAILCGSLSAFVFLAIQPVAIRLLQKLALPRTDLNIKLT